MAEEPFVRFVGAAKRERKKLARTKVRLFSSETEGDYLIDEVENALAPTARVLDMDEPVQSRPEYSSLDSRQRERVRSTKVYKGERFVLHWYETMQDGARCISIWAIDKVDDLYGPRREGCIDWLV